MSITTEALASYREVIAEMRDLLFDDVFSSNRWTTLPVEVQLELREFVDDGQVLFERILRPKLDNAIWNGLAGPGVESIRAKGEYESKPGRKAPTSDEVFARMKKR